MLSMTFDLLLFSLMIRQINLLNYKKRIFNMKLYQVNDWTLADL